MSDLNLVEELKKQLTYLDKKSVEQIIKAVDFATNAHKGQVRKSNLPYITHPLEVAIILATLQLDPASIQAGLLHDTIEDCNVTKTDLEKEFGADVAELVEGVTKLGKLKFQSLEEEQAENYRKMFLAMARDIRVVIVKLADRLHNMRTLKFQSPEKQRKIASETQEIFSPLAHRLGMWRLKWELEDLAFYYLQPEEFQSIKEQVASTRKERESLVAKNIKVVEDLMNESGVSANIFGRPKHFYSIYNKLKKTGVTLSMLYDTLGIRVIVGSIKECYEVLGLVHSKFPPINGRFKDYIAMPKTNMYQSLHTAVMSPEGKPFEIQIRTQDMHDVAEFGIAAHWQYKEGKASKFDGDFAWLREILEHQKENPHPKDFIQSLKLDLFIDEVFIFSPKGDIHVLSKGATTLDFAYRIHTEIGHSCIGAKINGQIVPLDYTLRSGDLVEIMTSKKPNPKIDWLNIVTTPHAKSKIKQWFKRQDRDETLKKGREKLETQLIEAGYLPKNDLKREKMEKLIQHLKLDSEDELFMQICQGDISPKTIIKLIEEWFHKEKVKEEKIDTHWVGGEAKKVTKQGRVKVLGEENILTYVAKCCHPVPGDPIIGFVTLGHGVSIHRENCSEILKLDKDKQSRLVEVIWSDDRQRELYQIVFTVEAFERPGILQDILNKITESKTNISEIYTKSLEDGSMVRAVITMEISDLRHVIRVRNSLKTIPDVYSVTRAIS